jgi:hypothetical protein
MMQKEISFHSAQVVKVPDTFIATHYCANREIDRTVENRTQRQGPTGRLAHDARKSQPNAAVVIEVELG